MKMSKEHTTQLWNAVLDNDYPAFNRINTRLLNAPTALKNVPMRIYIPTTTAATTSSSSSSPSSSPPQDPTAASFKVVQTLVPATGPDRRPRLLGQALKAALPGVFPSSRDPVLARAVMHGAEVPLDAPVEDLMREASYPDGWLCLVVVVL